ncbi:FkbM family methyltransferase [Phreatobacter aquaticus]|uniref:FkbM family methyltransferase n=1 Tax=Phreatobacter aquaticus TaxID=2570229 RepID=UPI00143D3614|nr:FkbM family methyltransferase [Phreatobacter aquaticus]
MTIRSWLRRAANVLPVLGPLLKDRARLAAERDRFASIAGHMAHLHHRVLAERAGLKLLLDTRSLVDWHVFIENAWEPRQIDMMMAAARSFSGDPRPKIFLDIGACWGLYALKAHALGLFDRIICFEPDRMNAAQLEAQLFLNEAGYTIEIDRRAVSNRSGTARLERAGDRADHNRGAAHLTTDEAASEPVETVALDDLFDIRDHILFIKLDVERHEAEALEGMARLIANNHVYLQVEIWPDRIDAIWPLVPPSLRHRASIDMDHVFTSFDPPSGLFPPLASDLAR